MSNKVILNGERNSTMLKEAEKALKRFGNTAAARKYFETKAKSCENPLPEKEVELIWHQAVNYYTDKISQDPNYVSPDEYSEDDNNIIEPGDDYLMSGDECLAKPKPQSWLIKNFIPRGKNTISIIGQSGSGKTFVVMSAIMAILAAGNETDWFGKKTKPGKVLYCCGEGGFGVDKRIRAACQELGIKSLPDFMRTKTSTALDKDKCLEKLINLLKQKKFSPDLIVVDTLNRFMSGEENSATDMSKFIRACDQLSKEFNSCVVIIHHTGLSDAAQKRARGSSALYASLDMEYLVKKENDIIVLSQTKAKDSISGEDMNFRLKTVKLNDEFDEDGVPIESAVLEYSSLGISPRLTQPQSFKKSLMQQAFRERGVELEDGSLFISRSDLLEFLLPGKLKDKRGNLITDRTALYTQINPRQQRFVGFCIKIGFIKEDAGQTGFVLIDKIAEDSIKWSWNRAN